MSQRKRIQILLYFGVLLTLIVVNSYLEYNRLNSNIGYHELPYWGRRAVNVSTFAEVILSPFELFKPLLIETGNLRDRESILSIVVRFVALPFSFLLYFKSIRIQFFRYLKRKFGRKMKGAS